MDDNPTTGRDPILHGGAVLAAIVAAFVGIGFLIAACTDDSDTQTKLHYFVVGWACVFASLVTAVMLHRKEH